MQPWQTAKIPRILFVVPEFDRQSRHLSSLSSSLVTLTRGAEKIEMIINQRAASHYQFALLSTIYPAIIEDAVAVDKVN